MEECEAALADRADHGVVWGGRGLQSDMNNNWVASKTVEVRDSGDEDR